MYSGSHAPGLELTVLAASALGAIVLSAAAPTWTPQVSGVSARLRGVSAVDDRVVWASGANGTILHSADGGASWQKLSIAGAEKLDFRDVDALSDRVAYALSIGSGEASRIYKTTDAGATWTLQFTNTDAKAFFDAMAFWDADRGIAFSDSVDDQLVILSTTDGGQTWSRIPQQVLPPAIAGEGAFAASGTNVAVIGKSDVWIGTTAGRVLHSSDAGRSWSVASTGVASGEATGIFSIAFRDTRHGIVVGGNYQKEGEAIDNAAVTSDGGRSWTLVKGLSGFRSVVAYLPRMSPPSLVAIGPSGADYSSDDGRTWTPVSGDGFHAFSAAPGGGTGWGVGEAGRIARLRW
jgi:photosystem II stability/assembly factor-like uncharacterized protein